MITPKAWALQAEQKGFRFFFKTHLGANQTYALVGMRTLVEARDQGRAAYQAGMKLMELVPGAKGLLAGPEGVQGFVRPFVTPEGVDCLSIEVGKVFVEQEFLNRLSGLKEEHNQRIKEREDLDLEFELKVREEVQADPRVISERMRVEVAQRGFTEALAQARAERAPLREAYGYVVSEKTL